MRDEETVILKILSNWLQVVHLSSGWAIIWTQMVWPQSHARQHVINECQRLMPKTELDAKNEGERRKGRMRKITWSKFRLSYDLQIFLGSCGFALKLSSSLGREIQLKWKSICLQTICPSHPQATKNIPLFFLHMEEYTTTSSSIRENILALCVQISHILS